jgi:hypothetical protein
MKTTRARPTTEVRLFVSHPPHSKEKSNIYLGNGLSIVCPTPMQETFTAVLTLELRYLVVPGRGSTARYVPWVTPPAGQPTPLQLLGNAEPRASSTSLTSSLGSYSFRRVCQATACDGLEARLPRRYLGPSRLEEEREGPSFYGMSGGTEDECCIDDV